MSWMDLPIAKRCAKCGAMIGQGESALAVEITGLSRKLFYCDSEPCGKQMVRDALPENPKQAPLKPSFEFSSLSSLSQKFDHKQAALGRDGDS